MPWHTKEEMARLKAIPTPKYEDAVREVNRWTVRKSISAGDLADRLGLGRSTVNQWLQGRWYYFHPQMKNHQFMTALIWEHVQGDPVSAPLPPPERLLATQNATEIRRLFQAGLRQRACAVLYGAPAAEKTFILKCLVAERQRAGHDDVIYIEASPAPSPRGLLQMLCAAAGTAVRSNENWPLIKSLVDDFRRRDRLPLIVVDEAQHLLRRPFDALETLRGLRNRTANDLAADRKESYGCGLLLAGSHDLYKRFERDKLLLAQWMGRITHRKQLTGMSEQEVLQVAARELGNGRPARISAELHKKILDASRDLDIFVFDENGQPAPPREYFSPRKLATWIDRARERGAGQRGAA
jgi:DNA transposition AAA+ family ATPase